MIATIDRFEGGDAVLFVRPDERERILVPRALIPDMAEGDIVGVCIVPVPGETESARERTSAMIDRLRAKNTG